jgi:hypothetical protein
MLIRILFPCKKKEKFEKTSQVGVKSEGVKTKQAALKI